MKNFFSQNYSVPQRDSVPGDSRAVHGEKQLGLRLQRDLYFVRRR